jgi:SCP-like extracellular
MRKSVLLAIAAVATTVMMAVPTFADNSGWRRDNRGWWYQFSNGSYPSSSWLSINNIWYYMDGSGYMQTGWLNYGGGWYYLDPNNGDMKVGWVEINNAWYYLNPANGGRLDTNTITPDGYYVDGSGVYRPNASTYNTTRSNNSSSGGGTKRSNSGSGGGSTRSNSGSGGGSTRSNSSSGGGSTRSNNSSNSGSNSSNSDTTTQDYYRQETKAQISTDEYEREVIEIVNAERAKNGLSALSMDSGLMDTAHLRSKELVILFSHDRPDGTDCFTAFPSGFTGKAENIAKGQTNPTNVMNSWMNSAGHRANILNPSYDSIGVGCHIENGKLHWVQVFGRSSDY